MSDYSATRSEYLKVMMGNKKDALAPYRPEQLNDLGDTSLDVASLSDDDINTAVEQMTGTQYENTNLFNSLSSEKTKRSEAKKTEEESSGKAWYEHLGDFFSNIGTSITEGVLSVVDDVWDFTIGVAGGIGGGWWGQENDFTDWVSDAMTDDRWITYATKALTLTDLTNSDMYTSDYWTDWSYEGITEEKNRAYEGQEWLHTGGNFVGKIIPSLVLAYFTGGSSAAAQIGSAAAQGGLAFASQYGSSASQALEEGATFQQASGYGAAKGAVSGAINFVSSKIGASALSNAGGVSAAAGNAIGDKVAASLAEKGLSKATQEGLEVFASKATQALVNAGFEAGEGFAEAMADPLLKQITYDSEALEKAFGDSEAVKNTLAQAGLAAMTSAVSSLATSAIREGGARIIQGKDRYYANFYTQKALTEERNLEAKVTKLADDAKSGSLSEEQLKVRLDEIDALSARVKANGEKALDHWNDYGEQAKAKQGAVETEESEAEDIKAPVDKLRYKRQLKDIEKLSTLGDVTETLKKVLPSTAKAKVIPNESGDGGDIVIDNVRITVKKDSNSVTYSDLSNPEAPEVEAEIENGKTVFLLNKRSEAETIENVFDQVEGEVSVRLPFKEGKIDLDISDLDSEQVGRLLNLTDDSEVSKIGNKRIYDLGNGKAFVLEGEAVGRIENYEGDFNNGDYTPAKVKQADTSAEEIEETPKTPKEEVEGKYGKDVSKAPASLIVEAGNADEGKTFNYTATKKMVDTMDSAISDMLNDENMGDLLGRYNLKGKTELTDDVFAQLNLAKKADKAQVLDYLKDKLMEMGVDYSYTDGNGKVKKEHYALGDLLGTDEADSLNKTLTTAFNELLANGKTSRYSKLMETYEAKVQRLIGENADLRTRAKVVAESQKKFNSLANKLGLNGKPNQVKTILSGGSDSDVAIVDMLRGLVKNTRVSSRTGLSSSPKAANRLIDFAKGYTYENYGDSYFWDEGIRSALDQIVEDGNLSTARNKVAGYFSETTELTTDEQTHINNLLDAINHKLSAETQRIYQDRVEKASKVTKLYKMVPTSELPKIIRAVSNAIDNAENAPQYLANYVGKENPIYDEIVGGWTKANGNQTHQVQKYNAMLGEIFEENGIAPKKGFSFLKKKVSFKGKKITKGQAASILFSAQTKAEIADGTNELLIENPKTSSRSIAFRLDGDADIETLKGLFTKQELGLLDDVSENLLNGEMKTDFINWFKKKYGYTPEVNEDFFALSASNAKTEFNEQIGGAKQMGQTWGRARSRVKYSGAYQIRSYEEVLNSYAGELAHQIGYSDYEDSLRVLFNTKIDFGDEDKYSLTDLLVQKAPNWASNKSVGGKNWSKYITALVTDSKVGDAGGVNGIIEKLSRGGQTAVLGLNPSSMAKQWASDFTTMGEVGITTYLKSKMRVAYNASHYSSVRKFLTGADNLVAIDDPEYESLKPIFALISDRFDNGGVVKAKLSSDVQSDIISKVGDVTLAGMGFMDEANNVINVWSVAETMAKDNFGYAYGSRENKVQALKYFADLVFKTQSNNNAMYVSPIRSGYKGQVNKLLFGMFASDSQNKAQQFDAVTREWGNAWKRYKAYEKVVNDANSSESDIKIAQEAMDYIGANYSKGQYAKKASGTVASLVMNGVFVAGVNEVVQRLLAKNDKRIDDWSDFNLGDFAKDASLEAFVNWMPYVSTVANAIENNSDVSVFTTDRINSLIDAFKTADTGDKVRQLVTQAGEMFGLPLSNIYKYVKGITRNVSEGAYTKAFAWLEGMSSETMTSNYKTAIKRDDVSGAVEILSINYSLYKTGTADRKTLLEVAKLSQKGYSAVARNVPDYITDEDGSKQTLTDDQKSSFSKYYKQANASVAKLITTTSYLKQDDEAKAKSIKKIYDLYYEFAKSKSLKSETSSKLGALLTITGGDYDVATAVLLIQENSKLVATNLKTKKEQAVSLVNKQSMTRNQKLLTLYLMGYGVSDESKTALRSYLTGLGMSQKEAKEFLP